MFVLFQQWKVSRFIETTLMAEHMLKQFSHLTLQNGLEYKISYILYPYEKQPKRKLLACCQPFACALEEGMVKGLTALDTDLVGSQRKLW